MPTLTVNRSDLWPVGTTVSVYPPGSVNDSTIRSAALASGTVAADGSLSITSANILSLTTYNVAAVVNGQIKHVRARSTLDVFDAGTFTATGNTTNNSASVTSVSVSAGTVLEGMRIAGPGIPAVTTILSVSGGTLVLSNKATATATGVALSGEAAAVWQAKVRRRKVAIGTT